MLHEIHEECGVFGIYDKSGNANVGADAYYALYALQHRGQESCGIAVNDDGLFRAVKDCGLVPDVFDQTALDSITHGQMALGHVRYSTTGMQNAANAQPLVIRHIKGPLALAHNGSLVNALELRERLELTGAIFHTTNDSEVIAYTITAERLTSKSIEQAIERAMTKIKGSYSLVVMSPQKLIAVRDPDGFRPLCMGRTKNGGYCFASESCAFDTLGATFVRDIDPGEIVVIQDGKERSLRTHCGKKGQICVFEYVYFARPDSVIEGQSVHEARINAGAFLAKEHPVDADVVFGVPDSGIDAAIGYSRQSGVPYGVGFIKNRYIGRTFIQPTQKERETAVKIKLNVLSHTVKGKRVVVIDDSIVRGTTSANIARSLREAGATEVHMRISSPPFLYPCYFGTDIDDQDKLIACRLSIDEIAKEIGVDTLGYLSVYAVNRIAEGARCGFCTGCFTGNYPISVPAGSQKDKFEQKIGKSGE